jgi:hypothetical protein
MKKIFLVVSVCVAMFALTACVTPAETAPGAPVVTAQTPAQVAAKVCPQVESTLTALSDLALEPTVSADLSIAQKIVDTVCSATPVTPISFTSLQSMANSALPAILTTIKAAALSADKQDALVLDITAANLVINGAINTASAVQ